MVPDDWVREPLAIHDITLLFDELNWRLAIDGG